MYAYLTLPCLYLCEMLDSYPMILKFCMMKLDTLLDILVLIWYFYQLSFLFYDCAKLVWQFVSHLCLFILCDVITLSNDLQLFWFFVWYILWMLWLSMNYVGILWIISDLIEIFHCGWSHLSFKIALNFNWSWNGFGTWYWCETFWIVSRCVWSWFMLIFSFCFEFFSPSLTLGFD